MGLLWGFPFFVHAEHTGRPTAAAAGVAARGHDDARRAARSAGFIAHNPWQRSTVVLSIIVAMMADLGRRAALAR